MYKEGWSVGLGKEGVTWGGTVWNTLKGGGTGGEGKHIFKPGDKLGQDVGALRKRGAGTPLETMTP